MPPALQYLSAARINGVMLGLQDPRLLPQQLIWLSRVPLVPAMDEEIMARFIGQVLIADLIADDAKAAVYSQGKFQFESTKIPNLKLGTSVNQSTLNLLDRLQAQPMAGDAQLFQGWENRTLENLLLGVRQRMEALIVAMLIDGFSYDRLGIKMDNVTWGMPSDLKVTPATPWTTAASATPVDDMLNIKLTAMTRYGADFNRATMSTQAFRTMIATTEFQAKARMFLAPNVSYTNLSLVNINQQRQIAENVLGMTIETYDARYWTQEPAGDVHSNPFLPINKVILSDSRNDNNQSVMDFANGVVTESIVAGLMASGMFGRLPANSYGPVAYPTVVPDLNPPNITYWGVARGFPRKHMLQSTAVLTVGTLTDSIAVGVPFPA